METDVKKSIIFYLKHSGKSHVYLSEKEFYENFIYPYIRIIQNLTSFEDRYLKSCDFSELDQLSKFSLYVFNPKLGSKKKFKISNKGGKIIFSSKIQSFGTGENGKVLRFVFNENGSLFFRIRSKAMTKFGVVDPENKYINVFYKEGSYFHNLFYSNNTLESYVYDNDKKLMETKNFYNEKLKSYRTLVFDLVSGFPVESKILFLKGDYKLSQEIGSDYVTNVHKDPAERNSSTEKLAGEIIDFVMESKGDFLSPITNDDNLLFNLCFPTENEKTVEIPF